MRILARIHVSIATLLISSFCAMLSAADTVSVFEKTILNIDKTVGDMTSFDELFGSKEFIRIYENPKTNYKDAVAFLQKQGASRNQKLIAVHALQRLSRKDYLLFLNSLLDLLETGKITYDIFRMGAFPLMEWNTTLQENYKDPKVKEFLIKAKASMFLKDDKDYIDRILSGEAARDVQEMRDGEQLKSKK